MVERFIETYYRKMKHFNITLSCMLVIYCYRESNQPIIPGLGSVNPRMIIRILSVII
jgi:hypothetical protein